ncbi:MAG: hypothetical protein HN348_18655, partial [Proteobacteria bacterium]|nr:hypothetical protein [Pseudomonadota bacterium]
MSTRFTPDAADDFREAVHLAGGVEVFAIGDVDRKTVIAVTITCRGQADRVTALIDRPCSGQVVIHNHPSGELTPSAADMRLASMYGDEGIGVVIVDNDLKHSNWVVEPYAKKEVFIDPEEIEVVFEKLLPKAMPDWEPRSAQTEMALKVAEGLNNNQPLLVEAGTGTGKSLAYLIPAALWAKANDGRVIVSTYTRALQGQLLGLDLPLLGKLGLGVEYAVLQGRNNYLCKRRLIMASLDEPTSDEKRALEALAAWDGDSDHGLRSQLPFPIEGDLWERVESDSDLTLGVRCNHYADCYYYQARRNAAAAHILVVNHALALVDLDLRATTGRGILPTPHRFIFDEGHHLEDAATGAASDRLNALAIRRAIGPLLTGKKRPGVLKRLVALNIKNQDFTPTVARAEEELLLLRDLTPQLLSDLAAEVLDPHGGPRRLTSQWEEWASDLHTVRGLAEQLQRTTEALDKVQALLEDVRLPPAKIQLLLDLRRGRHRLLAHADMATRFLKFDPFAEGDPLCRWVEEQRTRRAPSAALNIAPIAVGPTLKRILFIPFPGVTLTSATLTVDKSFAFLKSRIGLEEADEAVFTSPFDHERQALFGVVKGMVQPNEPSFLDQTGQAMVEAIQATNGGAFVLCTSFAAVRHYARYLRANDGYGPVLAQGEAGRTALLNRFRENQRAVLVGTDTYWEGVSVKGEGLRLIIIPRLPFRVPTHPLRIARMEQLQRQGRDPFRAYT